MTTTLPTTLAPIGTRVAVLPEVHGEEVTGTVVGYCPFLYHAANAYAGRMDLAYAVALDRPAYLDRDDLAPARRPFVSHILAHVESVETIAEEVTP